MAGVEDKYTLIYIYIVQSEIKRDYIRFKTILANIIPFWQTVHYTVSQAINMVCQEPKVLYYTN